VVRLSFYFSVVYLSFCLAACGSDTDRSAPAKGPASEGDTQPETETATGNNQFLIETNLGSITIELDPTNAPVTAENFARYVDDGFYDGTDGQGATIFHRVIDGFMIQGGGFTESGTQKSTHASIAIESNNGLSNLRGTVAMARTSDPNSATSQFFINHVDNDFLDYASASNPGYAVFGEVIEGLDVVDAIAVVQTGAGDKPNSDVVMTSVSRVGGE